MDNHYDLTKEEIEVFQAESQEQIQILDEGLVQLEQKEEHSQLIQELFRAAHTLKGSAGMIGHRDMVDLTHGLETALDGVRKDKVSISPELIDLCLEAVDFLRLFLDEFTGGEPADVDISEVVKQFSAFSNNTGKIKPTAPALSAQTKSVENCYSKNEQAVTITADIDPESIASAARAFQVLTILQEMGKIIDISPDQASIEAAHPVKDLQIEFEPLVRLEELKAALSSIPELFNIRIETSDTSALPIEEYLRGQFGEEDAEIILREMPRIGEFLLKNGYILQDQLDVALEAQKELSTEEPKLLGQVLLEMNFLTRESLEEAMAMMCKAMRSELRTSKPMAADQARIRVAEKTIRASVERLDDLMNQVGELITDRNRLIQIRSVFEDQFIGNEYVDQLSDTVAHLGRITDQLQAGVMGLRMLPISNVFNKFPRLVRDLARGAEKKVGLIVEGQDTELDRSVLEVISDPLIHLLRNAVDHGIETPAARAKVGKSGEGKIQLEARHEQGQIVITVQDDGSGIDGHRIKKKAVSRGLLSEFEADSLTEKEVTDLIFESGLSTAKKVSEVSGRGVGMDIVRTNIERLNGAVSVESWPGKGTKFRISLPLTLAVVPTLLVKAGPGTYAVPLITVTETLRIPSADIKHIKGQPAVILRGQILPLAHLRSVLGFPLSQNGHHHHWIVAVRSGNSLIGLIVDKLVREEEVMIKSMGMLTGMVSGVSGAAILGDGRIALVLEIGRIVKMATDNKR